MKKVILMLAAASLMFSGCSGGGPASNSTTTTTNTAQTTGGTTTTVNTTPGAPGTTTVTVDWKEFTPPDNSFTVQMPGEPKVISETPVLSVSSNTPAATYTVNRTTSGKKMTDAEMNNHANTASASGKMGEVKKTTLAGLPALEFEVDAGGTKTHNAMIFGDTNVYHLVVSPAGTGTPGPDDARKFFDSFRLGGAGAATGMETPGAATGGDMGTPGFTPGGTTEMDTATPGGMTGTATPGATATPMERPMGTATP